MKPVLMDALTAGCQMLQAKVDLPGWIVRYYCRIFSDGSGMSYT